MFCPGSHSQFYDRTVICILQTRGEVAHRADRAGKWYTQPRPRAAFGQSLVQHRVSLVAQMVKNPPAMEETQV